MEHTNNENLTEALKLLADIEHPSVTAVTTPSIASWNTGSSSGE